VLLSLVAMFAILRGSGVKYNSTVLIRQIP